MPFCLMSDHVWDKLASRLPPERGRGRPSFAHRPFVEAILWKQRTGASWRDLPERFGPWTSVYTRYQRWSRSGVWQSVLEVLQGDTDDQAADA